MARFRTHTKHAERTHRTVLAKVLSRLLSLKRYAVQVECYRIKVPAHSLAVTFTSLVFCLSCPGVGAQVSKVDVHSEREVSRGWSYRVSVDHDDGSHSEHEVRLAWVDHEHWCGGRLAPSRVVEVMFERILEATGLPPLPASFDLAKVRYWMPAIDQELRLSL